MTNAFITHQPSRHSDVADKHQASIAANLADRVEKAKAAQNQQLLALLYQEQQQLARQLPQPRQIVGVVAQWAHSQWQRLHSAIVESDILSVERIVGESGILLWRAYDPVSGETRYAESESEIVDWIETSRTCGVTPGILGLWGWQSQIIRTPARGTSES